MATKPTAVNADDRLEVMQCPIAKLADEDLAAIFKYLPPYERLIVSEVSTKWRDISQAPWRDVTRLDLSQVPTQNIHAVINKCPNLTSVSALRQNLGDFCRFVGRLSNLTSLNCTECDVTIQSATNANAASAILASVQWKELVWHNCSALLWDGTAAPSRYLRSLQLPSSLRRLQFVEESDKLFGVDRVFNCGNVFYLPLLECLILTRPSVCQSVSALRNVCVRLRQSPVDSCSHLRELYMDSPHRLCLVELVLAWRELEVLFLHNVDWSWSLVRANPARLMTQHRSLRTLVITASHDSDFDGEITIPVRKLFPNGFNAPPVPPLHLFLGKIAAERLRFHPSPTDAFKIYPIDAPLPEFLEKEEIKPIFASSWIASRIKEGAKEGVNLADYSFEGHAESISYVQE